MPAWRGTAGSTHDKVNASPMQHARPRPTQLTEEIIKSDCYHNFINGRRIKQIDANMKKEVNVILNWINFMCWRLLSVLARTFG